MNSDAPRDQERVVYLLKDGRSHLLVGDRPGPGIEGGALPSLLVEGWRIRSVHMTASAAVNPDQVLGIAVLSRDRGAPA
jgi:hypothetical protein